MIGHAVNSRLCIFLRIGKAQPACHHTAGCRYGKFCGITGKHITVRIKNIGGHGIAAFRQCTGRDSIVIAGKGIQINDTDSLFKMRRLLLLTVADDNIQRQSFGIGICAEVIDLIKDRYRIIGIVCRLIGINVIVHTAVGRRREYTAGRGYLFPAYAPDDLSGIFPAEYLRYHPFAVQRKQAVTGQCLLFCRAELSHAVSLGIIDSERRIRLYIKQHGGGNGGDLHDLIHVIDCLIGADVRCNGGSANGNDRFFADVIRIIYRKDVHIIRPAGIRQCIRHDCIPVFIGRNNILYKFAVFVIGDE